ncbi:MAG: glycosyltransferase family 9 protein [Candidatus Sulfotelmatobacter sp.]
MNLPPADLRDRNIDPPAVNKSPFHKIGNIDRILIVRLSAMGDVIHTLPAAQMLRETFPHAHIGWLIEERWAELLRAAGPPRRGPRSRLRPLVDEVHVVNLKAWGKSPCSIATLQRVATVWNDVRAVQYQIAIDLQGAIRSAVLARLSGARVVYGAAQPREAPASLWYTRKVITSGRHVIEQNISIARALIETHTGAAREASSRVRFVEVGCELPCDPQVEARIEDRLAELGVGEFAILNPGAGWGAKRWPTGRYGEVARGLAHQGLRSVVNFGPDEEELAGAVEVASAGAARGLQCTITELVALTRRARLFIGGDTGPLHLAAALAVPVVGIYGPTDPARNGPYGTPNIVLRNSESVTSHARRAEADEGMLGIGSGEVLTAAFSLLRGIRG